jgi:hypothetical protein
MGIAIGIENRDRDTAFLSVPSIQTPTPIAMPDAGSVGDTELSW